MRRGFGPTCVAIVIAALGAVAHGAVPSVTKRGPSRSFGAPNQGRLENGVHLEPSAYLRFVGAYAEGDAHWGIRELVNAIDHAAREVHRRYPDAMLGVGQLSRKAGGEIDRHASHESGRDADLAFYLVDSLGNSVQRDHFFAIRPDGHASSDPRLRFDDGRNFALIAALANDPHAHVTHIFIATHLRTRLLAHAAKVGASPALRSRMAELLMQPHHALPHDDHFHVRVACPWSSQGCVENALVSSAAKKHPAPMVKAAKTTKVPKPPTKRLVRARSTGKAASMPRLAKPAAAAPLTPDEATALAIESGITP